MERHKSQIATPQIAFLPKFRLFVYRSYYRPIYRRLDMLYPIPPNAVYPTGNNTHPLVGSGKQNHAAQQRGYPTLHSTRQQPKKQQTTTRYSQATPAATQTVVARYPATNATSSVR